MCVVIIIDYLFDFMLQIKAINLYPFVTKYFFNRSIIAYKDFLKKTLIYVLSNKRKILKNKEHKEVRMYMEKRATCRHRSLPCIIYNIEFTQHKELK